jgi:hypothetical protein
MHHYILEGKEPKLVDLMTWGKWMECMSNRRIGYTELSKGIEVSTVFLGTDHGFGYNDKKILFETLVCGGKCDEEMLRYSTYEEAEKGHEAMVRHVKATEGIK